MPYKTPTRLRKSAYQRQQGTCCYCGKAMWIENVKAFARDHGYTLAQARQLQCTAEHLRSRATGGADSPDNIAAACWYCNSRRHKRKQAMEPRQYRQYVVERLQKGKWHGLH